MKKRTSYIYGALLVLICAIYLLQEETGLISKVFPGLTSPEEPLPEGLMELPATSGDDIILTHTGFIISYNAEARLPEWVAYELTADETRGDVDRDESVFRMDPTYKGTQAMREDYFDSGWTRGHMACAADFQWDEEAMNDTFYLTNICPQDEELNKGDWNYLEKQVRRWARDYGKVWVVSGPIVGTNRYGIIGDRGVTVPDSFFKAVLAENRGKYHAIAFVMDNDDKRYWLDDCAMTVDELEDITGLDFFPMLPDEVEKNVESKITLSFWDIKER
ncbi:MAG: DNA/RNA non-specific endonuclease [Bacteroidales bacterium]|nr:DNA/RNA non-specific endonuclease [Bacteroidales bacterium]MBR5055528.1 DNA/RNA non-specific endonuclease [Bacteroidales bacterium]